MLTHSTPHFSLLTCHSAALALPTPAHTTQGSHAQYSAPALVQPHASAPPTAGPRAPKDPAAAAAATITGASTVAKRVPAEQNKQLLSMVRVRITPKVTCNGYVLVYCNGTRCPPSN